MTAAWVLKVPAISLPRASLSLLAGDPPVRVRLMVGVPTKFMFRGSTFIVTRIQVPSPPEALSVVPLCWETTACQGAALSGCGWLPEAVTAPSSAVPIVPSAPFSRKKLVGGVTESIESTPKKALEKLTLTWAPVNPPVSSPVSG